MRKATGRALLVVLALTSLLAVAAPAAVAQDGAGTVVFHVPLAPTGDEDGLGEAVLRFNPASNELCYVIVVQGIGEPTEPGPLVGEAHIHGPLPATGIFVDLETEFVQAGASDVFVASECIAVTAEQVAAILANPSSFYVNIHTVAAPGGAIEGALG